MVVRLAPNVGIAHVSLLDFYFLFLDNTVGDIMDNDVISEYKNTIYNYMPRIF